VTQALVGTDQGLPLYRESRPSPAPPCPCDPGPGPTIHRLTPPASMV
jgi:hypothetical protein